MAKPAKIDYDRLGRDFEAVVIKNHFEVFNAKRQIWLSFIKGIFGGLGGVIGATLMVAVLLWLLHILGGVPFIGHYINNVGTSIQKGK